ncbi:hypothetical protein WICMUC_005673 [Wickerhamomyces mucosus]|uniref:peptidylprolyl isomerase n=1 Tax=Wickerhamomyces mucosus TaxID=1378264 RepID=A0A9P8P708_9ASCO|nr:hypothetical protein WICMUC_005673 [Wickerhamomyces mucosus]
MKIETIHTNVFLDIAINDERIGRIVIELFDDLAPKASENFLRLCKGNHQSKNGNFLTLKNNLFHKVIRNFMIQAGDIENCSNEIGNDLGLGGLSIYDSNEFEDENLTSFETIHNLAMANIGPNTNTSQFFINTYPSPHLNGKHTIFGKVIHGKSTIRTIESQKVDDRSVPIAKVEIVDCGEWKEGMAIPVFNASYSNIAGDIFEEYPEDDDHFDKDKCIETFEACLKIKEAGGVFFKTKDYKESFLKYIKALRYVNEFIPDKDSEPELEPNFQDLKKKIYLNLSLVSINLKNFNNSLIYSNFLLDSDNLTDGEFAKGYYRRGLSYLELKKYQESLIDFQKCLRLNPNDKVVVQRIEQVENMLEDLKKKERQKYSKFFG